MLYLMIDANFRAKLKDRGLNDFEISPGWSYYVESKEYKKHVDSLPSQDDVCVPSALHVLNYIYHLTEEHLLC